MHATDIRNRFFGPRDSKKSSWELLHGSKPRLDHIRVFGCLAWVHIPAEKRKKLDDKAEKGLLLSCKASGLYKVWIIERRTALMVRHVRFIEETYPGKEEFHIVEEQGEEPFSGTRKLPSNLDGPIPPSQVSRESPPAEGTGAAPPGLQAQNEELPPAESDEIQVREDLTYYPPTGADRRASEAEESLSVHDRTVVQQDTHGSAAERRYPTRKRQATAVYSPSGLAKTTRMLPQTDPANLIEAFSGDESNE